jgi:hypothetical protein
MPEFTFHGLRHTFARQLVMAGEDRQTVSKTAPSEHYQPLAQVLDK